MRRDLSAGPEQQKKTPPREFFFFAAAPAKGKGRRSPVGSRHGARAKKKTPPRVFFFTPCRRPTGLLLPLPFPGAGAKKKHPGWCFFFFCSGPVPASNGASPSLAFRRGRSKKKHPGWCFFFCSGPVPASNGASPSLAFRRGRSKKKKTPWVVFFFCCGPARTLTHSLRAWVAMPPPRRGGVFFCCGPARTGVVLFFCCGPARTLTHSRWAGAISARPGWCFFFLLRPRRVFLDNSKTCLGYYIGSKKTRRGHSKKKHHFLTKSLEPFNIYTQARSQFRRSQTPSEANSDDPSGMQVSSPDSLVLKGNGGMGYKNFIGIHSPFPTLNPTCDPKPYKIVGSNPLIRR